MRDLPALALQCIPGIQSTMTGVDVDDHHGWMAPADRCCVLYKDRPTKEMTAPSSVVASNTPLPPSRLEIAGIFPRSGNTGQLRIAYSMAWVPMSVASSTAAASERIATASATRSLACHLIASEASFRRHCREPKASPLALGGGFFGV